MQAGMTRFTRRAAIVLGVGAALACGAASAADAPPGLDAPVQATWTRLPLRQWAERASTVVGKPVILDRRIDPDLPVTLTAAGESWRDLLTTVAVAAGATAEELAGSVRIVPAAAAGKASRADRDRELRVAALPAGPRAAVAARRPWRWAAGARPGELVAGAAAEAGVELAGLDAIPHDHFPAADLPPLSLAERLDLVLAHFDRRVIWTAARGRAAGRIISIDAEILPAAVAAAADRPVRRGPSRRTVEPLDEFTLRLEAPLDQALAAICGRLGLELELDAAALAAHGIAPGEIVRASVEEASRDELLGAVLQPVGLTWKIDGKRLLVFPATPAADALTAAIAARVAAQAGKPSIHDDQPTIERALEAAGMPADAVARLFASVEQADLPGMAAGLDAFLFFTRDPEWRPLRQQFAEYLELPEVTQFDADRVRPLAGYGGVVTLPAITTLAPETAAALASFGGDSWGAALEFPAVEGLEPDAAAAIARSNALLVFPHLRGLSPEAARRLASHEGIGIVLGGLAELPADVAGALAETKSIQGLLLPDLKSLDSEPLARRLARQDHVFLPQVTAIEPRIAASLRDNEGGELALPGLERLTPEVARQLVGAGYYWLRLGGAEHLSVEAAAVLARHNGQLTFPGPVPFPAAAAAELARHANVISLPRVAHLPADVAKALAPHEGSLILGGLTDLRAETASLLVEHAGAIHLPAVRRLTPEVATTLAPRSGSLSLSSLATIDPATAAAFAAHAGGPLTLGGISALSPEAAAALAATPDVLALPNLTTLTPDVARALAAHRGRLVLESVADLPADVAAELARHEGGLVLDGVGQLSTAAAAALAEAPGMLSLGGLERITPRGLELLLSKPGISLPETANLELVREVGVGNDDIVIPGP